MDKIEKSTESSTPEVETESPKPSRLVCLERGAGLLRDPRTGEPMTSSGDWRTLPADVADGWDVERWTQVTSW